MHHHHRRARQRGERRGEGGGREEGEEEGEDFEEGAGVCEDLVPLGVGSVFARRSVECTWDVGCGGAGERGIREGRGERGIRGGRWGKGRRREGGQKFKEAKTNEGKTKYDNENKRRNTP